jgi:hypothetical protein
MGVRVLSAEAKGEKAGGGKRWNRASFCSDVGDMGDMGDMGREFVRIPESRQLLES